MRAIGAPILAGTPCSTMMSITPSAFLAAPAPARTPNRLHDRRPVTRPNRAEVADLGVDVLPLELFRRLVREHGHPRHADDRDVGALASDRSRSDGGRVVVVGHH